jgi:AraC-like DNA-binding protein
MDLLADVLHQAGLRRRILNSHVLGQPVALAFPCDRSFGFHVVTQGRLFVYMPDAAPLELHAGDVAFMARGCDHIVSTEPQWAGELTPVVAGPGPHSVGLVQDESRALGTLISGAYQVWHTPVHPFFSELPRWYVLRAGEVPRFDEIELVLGLLAREIEGRATGVVGSETVVQSLLDVLFTQLIRKLIEHSRAVPQSWGHALQQAQVRTALELMHEDCAHEWTLDELASRVGLSRAGFAQKFRAALGTPPLQYLTTLRVQKAMRLLSVSEDKLEAIAQAVGYRDAFSFSKVFKKLVGVPPKEYRQRDQQDRLLAYRFS